MLSMTHNSETKFQPFIIFNMPWNILNKPFFFLVFPVFFISIILLYAHPSFGETNFVSGNTPNVKLNPMGISSSAECGKCHKDIYSSWKHCLHANSAENPVFRTAFLQAHFKIGEAARKICLTCHAPVAYLNGDFELAKPVTREGVNCDYCHTISKVNPDNPYSKYHHEFGLIKQGPLQNVKSPVHETRFNELFKNSAMCAGCHELESSNGMKIIETFSEWKESPYPAKGIHCQNCHMRKVKGKISSIETAKIMEAGINSHDVAAGHALSMREKSLDLKIRDIQINKQKVVVTVEITNQGAGHKIPTGLPTKKIILEVAIKSENGGSAHIQQKVYQKLIEDENGQIVDNIVDIMLGKGVKIYSDNRIGPLETRGERFTFFVPEMEGRRVTATVYYSHTPEVIQPSRVHIKLNEVTQQLGQ